MLTQLVQTTMQDMSCSTSTKGRIEALGPKEQDLDLSDMMSGQLTNNWPVVYGIRRVT